jgi:L,D-peptidoglycan transpeptidase YkuD (ErfK/YbiS/YcfS/YnhG family)
MPYFRSDVYDWWNGNVESPNYNRHVRAVSSPGGASENLYRAGAVYDYAAVIGYNLDGVPGAGSAFFVHVSNGSATAGCVAVSRTTMVQLLRWLDPAKDPWIRIGVYCSTP